MGIKDNYPQRRNRLDEMVPAESRIIFAMQAIEEMPADESLTEAIVLLEKAKNKISDYVDSQKSIRNGEEIGELCNRDGCNGVLIEGQKQGDGCYCHKVAPCSYCLQYPIECPECGFNDIINA